MNTKRSLLKRLRGRLGSRGVAMVEGAVVFPVMVGFMIMLELAHHSFDAYITVGHVARERVWSAATTGSLIGQCSGGARDDQLYTATESYFTIAGATGGTGSGSGSPDLPTGGQINPPAGLPGSGGFFNYTADATANVTVSRGGRTFNTTPKSQGMVYCNQKFYGTIVQIISNALKG